MGSTWEVMSMPDEYSPDKIILFPKAGKYAHKKVTSWIEFITKAARMKSNNNSTNNNNNNKTDFTIDPNKSENDLCCILYTCSLSDVPKGIKLSHKNLIW